MTPESALKLAKVITAETGYIGYVKENYRPTGQPDQPATCYVVVQQTTETGVDDCMTIDDHQLEIAALFVALSKRFDLSEFFTGDRLTDGVQVPDVGIQMDSGNRALSGLKEVIRRPPPDREEL